MAKRHHRQARRGSRTTRQSNQSLSLGWIWLLTGILVGILGAVSIYQLLVSKWAKINPLKVVRDVSQSKSCQSSKVPNKTVKDEQKKQPAQRFEFYNLLPGMEVPISDALSTNSTSANKLPLSSTAMQSSSIQTPALNSPPPPPKTQRTIITSSTSKSAGKSPEDKQVKIQKKFAAAQYLLQAGTFPRLDMANNLKTRLVSQGFAPRIQKVEAEEGLSFRVTLGPFPSEAIALKQKARLEKQRIHAILILQRY